MPTTDVSASGSLARGWEDLESQGAFWGKYWGVSRAWWRLVGGFWASLTFEAITQGSSCTQGGHRRKCLRACRCLGGGGPGELRTTTGSIREDVPGFEAH